MRYGGSVPMARWLAEGAAALDELEHEPAGPDALLSPELPFGDRNGRDVLGLRRPQDVTSVTDIPPDYVRFELRGRPYYRAGWRFYEAHQRAGNVFYSEIAPPYGAVIDNLPPQHETLVIADQTYYRHKDTYYVAEVMNGVSRYAVVEPPEQASLPLPLRHLRRMSDYLAQMQQFSVEATDMMDQPTEPGRKSQGLTHRTVHVSRPDRMRVDSTGSHINRSSWYDGKTLSMFDRTQNRYLVTDMPSAIDPMLDEVAARLGIRIPLADLLYSDVYRVLITDAGTNVAQYLGKVKLVNIECHHLAFDSDKIHWQIWIEAGDRPLPRKLEVTYKDGEERRRYSVTLRQWDLTPYFSDDHFVFRPPAKAERFQIPPSTGSQ